MDNKRDKILGCFKIPQSKIPVSVNSTYNLFTTENLGVFSRKLHQFIDSALRHEDFDCCISQLKIIFQEIFLDQMKDGKILSGVRSEIIENRGGVSRISTEAPSSLCSSNSSPIFNKQEAGWVKSLVCRARARSIQSNLM